MSQKIKQEVDQSESADMAAAALVGFEYLAASQPSLAVESAAAMLGSDKPEVRLAGLAMGRAAILKSEGKGLRSNALAAVVHALLCGPAELEALDFARSAPEAVKASAARIVGALSVERALAVEGALPGVFTGLQAKSLWLAPESLCAWMKQGKVSQKKGFAACVEAGWAFILAERQGQGSSAAAESAKSFCARVEAASPGWMKAYWKRVWRYDPEASGNAGLRESLAALALPSPIDPFGEASEALSGSWKLRARVVDAVCKDSSESNARRAGRALGALCAGGAAPKSENACEEQSMVYPMGRTAAYAAMSPGNASAALWMGWSADNAGKSGNALAYAEGLMESGADAPLFGAIEKDFPYYSGPCDLRGVGYCAWGMAMQCSRSAAAASSPAMAWMLSGSSPSEIAAERKLALAWLGEIRDGKRFRGQMGAPEGAERLCAFVEAVELSMSARAPVVSTACAPFKRRGL
jgi:hypothetical protein